MGKVKEETVQAAVMPLSRRILEIQKEIGFVGKNGRNSFQNYDYATETDFLLALKPLLNKYGVIVIPELAVPPTVESAGKDGNSKLTTIVMRYKLVNADNAEDYFVVQIPGQGMDAGDKGVYKAITGAKKYFISNTFMIPTGDDPEADSGPVVRKQPKAAPKLNLQSAINEDF